MKTSEELLGISKQPAEQCPIINKIIDAYQKIQEEARELEKQITYLSRTDNIDDVRDIENSLDWIRYSIQQSESIDNLAEELRDNIQDLRGWGQEWKDLAKKLMKE